MSSPYDILFEPVQIGPVTAPNRFFQVPHCNGMGYRHPLKLATMRGIKAEGGWGTVCTEEVEIHPMAEFGPAVEGRLWDDRDIPYHRLTTDAIHAHGALAGIEFNVTGHNASNPEARLPPMAPTAYPAAGVEPVQTRTMDRADIKMLRQWHIDAARRAKAAGYDLIYAYAGHDLSILMHFLQHRKNRRTDEYGGSTENRVRIIREVITDMKDAVGDTCAIALRLAVEELRGGDGIQSDGEAQDIVGLLADLPDLWDVNVSDWDNDSATARFEPNEGYQDTHTAFVKKLTNKPVVGVGRYTSADGMVARVKQGRLDLIGAARPSIADPFLPNKVREGRIDEIRECIGCNICVSSDHLHVPYRCTQNPTAGEEWRRGWHPEKIEPKAIDGSALVVGAGPAGLECAFQLSRRGHDVVLAEAGTQLGGRLIGESALPGLASYIRVKDYREHFLLRDPNVEIYFESELDAPSVLEFGFPHVFVATGARWRRDGIGRHWMGVELELPDNVLTPDDIMAEAAVSGDVVIFDDDHYYMGGVIAEKLAADGCHVTLVTPQAVPSSWTVNTLEQHRIQKRLLEAGVRLVLSHAITGATDTKVEAACVFTDRRITLPSDRLILVTSRQPVDGLYHDLVSDPEMLERSGIETVLRIGDCLAPGTVASATYLGHLAARNLGGEDWTDALYRREVMDLSEPLAAHNV